jgi:hypothetical protein
MSQERDEKSEIQAAVERARAVKRAHESELMSKANVVGVGVGMREKGGSRTDEVVLVVMVREKLPLSALAPEDVIPKQVDGVPVDVQEVGELGIF